MEQKVCSLTIRGETKQYPLDTTFQQIADEYQKQFENKIVLVKFQNDLKELSQSVLRDGSLEFDYRRSETRQGYVSQKFNIADGDSSVEAISKSGASGAAFHWSGVVL